MKTGIPLYNTFRARLANSRLFHGLSQDLLDDMLRHFRLETWNRGSVHSSDVVLRRFYVVMEGRMELLQAHPVTGKQIAIMILKAGDVYDVLSLLDDKEHPVIPAALDDLQLLSAPLASVRAWISAHPEFNQNFLPYLAEQIRMREAVVADLGLFDTETRLARVILRYATLEGSPDAQSGSGIEVSLLNGLSNEKLAEMVGSARQVVNRHLQALKKAGVLHTDGSRMIIDDLYHLRMRADALGAALARDS